MIWLCDLPKANARRDEQGNIEILEDNSKGFFRISEKPENLRNYRVYIQVKSGQIYRVSELFRRESSGDKESTIRFFVPKEEYTEEEFIDAIKTNSIGKKQRRNNDRFNETTNSLPVKQEDDCKTPKTLRELWKPEYYSIVVKNTEDDREKIIYHNGRGGMYRDYKNHIKYRFVNYYSSKNKYCYSRDEYPIGRQEEQRAIWILVTVN